MPPDSIASLPQRAFNHREQRAQVVTRRCAAAPAIKRLPAGISGNERQDAAAVRGAQG